MAKEAQAMIALAEATTFSVTMNNHYYTLVNHYYTSGGEIHRQTDRSAIGSYISEEIAR